MKLRWIVGIIAMIALVSAVSAAGIVISVNGQTVGAGSTAVIPVTVSGASGLGGVDLTVTYDPKVLKFVSAEAGALSTNGMIESNEAMPGTVLIGAVDSAGMTGAGTIVDMTFTVIGATGATSPVDVEVRGAYTTDQKDVASQVTGGTITVGAAGSGAAAGNKSPVNPVVVPGAVALAGIAMVIIRKRS
ncbi:MAG: cohesin domain-containing protein [Methanoregula sp.]|jgi:hypothetical protein